MVPFMCRPPLAFSEPSGFTVPGWHELQFGFCGCGEGGGSEWQLPQAAWVPSPFVHLGVVFVPPFSVAPWQYAVQVALSRSQEGFAPLVRARSPNTTRGRRAVAPARRASHATAGGGGSVVVGRVGRDDVAGVALYRPAQVSRLQVRLVGADGDGRSVLLAPRPGGRRSR